MGKKQTRGVVATPRALQPDPIGTYGTVTLVLSPLLLMVNVPDVVLAL